MNLDQSLIAMKMTKVGLNDGPNWAERFDKNSLPETA